jgi:hypothetical protein
VPWNRTLNLRTRGSEIWYISYGKTMHRTGGHRLRILIWRYLLLPNEGLRTIFQRGLLKKHTLFVSSVSFDIVVVSAFTLDTIQATVIPRNSSNLTHIVSKIRRISNSTIHLSSLDDRSNRMIDHVRLVRLWGDVKT